MCIVAIPMVHIAKSVGSHVTFIMNRTKSRQYSFVLTRQSPDQLVLYYLQSGEEPFFCS